MVPVADSLYEAISSYDLDAVKIGRALIKNGADVHTRHNGATLLHDAAKAGDLGFTKLLLESGVSRNVKDLRGKTPLFYAKKNKKERVLPLLKSDLSRKLGSVGTSVDWIFYLLPYPLVLAFFFAFVLHSPRLSSFIQAIDPFGPDFYASDLISSESLQDITIRLFVLFSCTFVPGGLIAMNRVGLFNGMPLILKWLCIGVAAAPSPVRAVLQAPRYPRILACMCSQWLPFQ